MDALLELTNWLWGLAIAALRAILDLLADAVTWVLEMILVAMASVLSLIPSPSFLTESNALGALLSGLPPFALFVIGQLHVAEAFAVIGAGVAFRLARKLATLGQW